MSSSPFGKLFNRRCEKEIKRGNGEKEGKRGEKRNKEEKKRKKGRKKTKGKLNRGMVGQKGEWEAKKDDFVVNVSGSFSNWAWEGFQVLWNNIHPCLSDCLFFCS